MARHAVLFVTDRGLTHQAAALEAAPPELEITMKRAPSREEIISLLPGQEFLITERSGKIDGDIIRAGKNLRLIQRLGSQTHDIDLEAARQAGIPVCYWPVRTCVFVAEHMILQMLGLAKRLREVMSIAEEAGDWGKPPQKCDEDYFAYNWSRRQQIRGLYQSTVGIVGFGEIGTELAHRLKHFGCTVLYHKRSRLPEATETSLAIQYASLDELLKQSDYVCNLAPFSADTDHFINRDFVARMKTGACLVSCGSGGTMDEAALAVGLASGHLFGVATDTHDWEPVRPDHPLLPQARQKEANVILTPHTAAGVIAAAKEERLQDYENLLRTLQGKPLLNRLV